MILLQIDLDQLLYAILNANNNKEESTVLDIN